MATDPLLHLTTAAAIDVDGSEPLRPDPDQDVVPCVTVDTAAGMARLLHAGTADLVLVVIDPRRVAAPVRWRDRYGLGRDLPEVAGPVPREAVVAVLPFPPGRGGRWSRPAVEPLP